MEISISELEQVRNDYAELGRKLERERIIKLLDKDYWHSQLFNFSEVICFADCEMCKTIALIKGDK